MGTSFRYGVLLSALLVACSSDDKKTDADARPNFCNDWAAAYCKRIYACPSPDVTLDGTEADCVSAFVYLCTRPPKSDEPSDVNCAGSGSVDANARSACLNKLSSVSCDEFNSDSYSDRCGEVCSRQSGAGGSGATGGSGGNHSSSGGASSSGGGNSGGSANHSGGSENVGGDSAMGGSAPTITDAHSACVAEGYITCDFEFRCLTADERTDSSLSACRSAREDDCDTANADCPDFDAAAAKTCVSKVSTLSCEEFLAKHLPEECKQTSMCL